MDKREAGRLGGTATAQKHGRDHMSAIGKKGYQATMAALTVRQNLDTSGPFPFKHLIRNLESKRKGR